MVNSFAAGALLRVGRVFFFHSHRCASCSSLCDSFRSSSLNCWNIMYQDSLQRFNFFKVFFCFFHIGIIWAPSQPTCQFYHSCSVGVMGMKMSADELKMKKLLFGQGPKIKSIKRLRHQYVGNLPPRRTYHFNVFVVCFPAVRAELIGY